MSPLNHCPLCGGDLVEKEVEKLLRGGIHMAMVKVSAEVCLHCGERLYSRETVTLFESIRERLSHRELDGFEPMGQAFQVPASFPVVQGDEISG